MTHKVQIDNVIRDATQDETQRIEARIDENKAQAKTDAKVANAKQSARAKLAALGLTDEEVAAFIP